LKVYGQKDEPCYQCGAAIQKIVMSQRGTHFCSTCQPRAGGSRRNRKGGTA
jgi:formamidopyrimidine-DNA glycosylase